MGIRKISSKRIVELADKLPGGKADDRPDSDFDSGQLQKGIEVEYEHTKDKDLAKEITKDHLVESPDYYRALDKMERSLGISSRYTRSQIVEAGEESSRLEKLKERRDPDGLEKTNISLSTIIRLAAENAGPTPQAPGGHTTTIRHKKEEPGEGPEINEEPETNSLVFNNPIKGENNTKAEDVDDNLGDDSWDYGKA